MILELLAAVAVAGGAALLLQRYTPQHTGSAAVTADGIFAIGTPFKAGTPRSFHDITLHKSGFVLHDAAGATLLSVQFMNVYQVSAVRLAGSSAHITLHLEVAQSWQILTLQLKQTDMTLMVGSLRHVLPAERIMLDNRLPDFARPFPARLVSETLQGEVLPEAEVALYFVPPMLVVLKDEQVVAKLDTRTVRRVLAVERSAGRMEALLNRAAPDGLIRLYSLHETAVFALASYRELAEAVAQFAGCSVEFINRDEKMKSR